MEEKTLQLAQTLARQTLLTEEQEEAREALDGSPRPLRRMLHGAAKGEPPKFRSVCISRYLQ